VNKFLHRSNISGLSATMVTVFMAMFTMSVVVQLESRPMNHICPVFVP